MTQDASDILSDNTIPPITEPVSESTQETAPISSGDDNSSTDEIAALKLEINQLKDQLARSQADYSNLVRRSREEQAQIGEWSENKLILKFLPVLDNLERAMEHTPGEFKTHAWTDGLVSIIRSLQKTFTDLGTTPMNAVGAEVNPDLHEVISQIPNSQTTIQAEVEKGYLRNGKALRHAKVIVGSGEMAA